VEFGDAEAYLFPFSPVYATAWEKGLLTRLAEQETSPQEILRELRRRKIDSIWINWAEIARLRRTYGWWDEVDPSLIDRLRAAGAREIARTGQGPDGLPAIQVLDVPGKAEPRSNIQP